MINFRMTIGFICYMMMGIMTIFAFFPKKAADYFESLGDKLWGGKGNLIGK